MKKNTLCIVCGGRSAEHEVSLHSARNIAAAVDTDTTEIVLVGIDKHGALHLHDPDDWLINAEDPTRIALARPGPRVAFACRNGRGSLAILDDERQPIELDVVFPVLHGTFGEDGAVQGLIKMAGLPCVGCDIAASAACMDKELAKRLLREAGIPSPAFIVVRAAERATVNQAAIVQELGLPIFVKPARLGSSIGINRVEHEADLAPMLDIAFRFDTKVIVEAAVSGRELECAVLGNAAPRASVPGEVIPRDGFYSYDAKYVDPEGAQLLAPADLDRETCERVQALAVRSFQALACTGMARVDFFLTPDGRVYVNELNTIPGFTRISMYPRLWQVSGLSYRELVAELVQLALERFAAEQALCTDFTNL